MVKLLHFLPSFSSACMSPLALTSSSSSSLSLFNPRFAQFLSPPSGLFSLPPFLPLSSPPPLAHKLQITFI